MSSATKRIALPVPVPQSSGMRRERVLRDLKLALVDQKVQAEAAGCNPYDALQGTGRRDRWQTRRR